MAKRIRLSEEAYERLEAHKSEEETFSEVVLRLTGGRPLLELGGILSDDQAEAVAEAITERRERRRKELDQNNHESGDC